MARTAHSAHPACSMLDWPAKHTLLDWDATSSSLCPSPSPDYSPCPGSGHSTSSCTCPSYGPSSGSGSSSDSSSDSGSSSSSRTTLPAVLARSVPASTSSSSSSSSSFSYHRPDPCSGPSTCPQHPPQYTGVACTRWLALQPRTVRMAWTESIYDAPTLAPTHIRTTKCTIQPKPGPRSLRQNDDDNFGPCQTKC